MLYIERQQALVVYAIRERLALFLYAASIYVYSDRRELHTGLPDFDNFSALDVHPGDSRILFTGGSVGPVRA